jgi:hypothetical protein
MPGRSPVNVSKDFEELLGSLRSRGVKALVVGGYALAFHAKPRFTKDFDLWVETSEENIQKLLAALSDFGFGGIGLTRDDFAEPGRFVQLGFPPNRIDLMTSIPGLEFASAWENRVEDRFGEEAVFYLSRQDLIASKRAAGRLQDLADLEVLET